MDYLKDSGFVIRRINFGEADRYITLFTKEHGKIEVIAKGVRKITSRRASHIELLNLIQFQAVKTSKNYVLTEVQLVDSFEDLKQSLQSISMLFLISELVEKLCPYGQQHEDIFELMYKVLHKPDSDDFTVHDEDRNDSLTGSFSYSPSPLRGEGWDEGERNADTKLFSFQVELLSKLGFWDQKKRFKDEADLRQFIENILERKIKTKIYS